MLIRFFPHCADGSLNQMSPPCTPKTLSGTHARNVPQNILQEMEKRGRGSENSRDILDEIENEELEGESDRSDDRNKPRRYPTYHPTYTPQKTSHPTLKPSSLPSSSPLPTPLPVPTFTAVVTQHASNKNDPYLLATQPLVFPLNPKGMCVSVCVCVCVSEGVCVRVCVRVCVCVCV